MRVFSACMTVVKRHFGSLLLYFGVFLTLSIIMPRLSAEQFEADFSAIKPNFAIISRDGNTPLIEGLIAYLGKFGNEVILEDSKDAIQDAAFFHAADYIAIIPEGFTEAFYSGKPLMIETVPTTESAKAYYADSLVNQYLNYGESAIEADVVMKRFGESAPVGRSFYIYMQMSCYIIMVMIILCMCNITSAFRRPDLRMRNLCSPMKPRSQSLQQALCGVLIAVAAWLLLTVLGLIMYGSELAGADRRAVALILLNAFVFMFAALAFASLVSNFAVNPSTQNAAANLVSLGLCFLGGVFVPLEMLGDGMLTAAKFTPNYWYITALDRIAGMTSFGADALNPVWQAMLIQLAFALAVFCAALAAAKHLNQSERRA